MSAATDWMNARFQLAALQIAFLCKMPTEYDVRHSLECLPDTLTHAYDEIYKRILAQKGSAPQLALNAFRWIQCSYEALRSETLLDAIAVEVGASGECSHKSTIKADDMLRVCQNLLILDKRLNVFRFAHLSVDEYLMVKLPDIYSHAYVAKVCFSLLRSPHCWDRYDRTLQTREGDYGARHLLLHSTVFWPWHFSHCEAANDSLKTLAETFMSTPSYREWLLYHRTMVGVDFWTVDSFWSKIYNFRLQESDDPIFSACVFGLSRTFELFFMSHVDTTCMRKLLPSTCKFGYLEIARLLIDKGANVSAVDEDGWTPLHVAAQNEHKVVASLLIDGGADVSAVDEDEWTPLHVAAQNGHEEVAQLLIDRNADVSVVDKDWWTPLYVAAQNGHEGVARLLIDRDADVSAVDEDGWTPLYAAAQNGHEVVARLLIDRGADVSVVDKYGRTPLYVAAQNGHDGVARLLIDRGANVRVFDKNGWTPLYVAAQNGHKAVARMLIDRGADISAAANNGEAPLHSAAQNGHEAVARLLIDKGADISAAYMDGWTPLHVAAHNGHVAVARLLIDKGADILAVNKDGRTPLDAAASGGGMVAHL